MGPTHSGNVFPHLYFESPVIWWAFFIAGIEFITALNWNLCDKVYFFLLDYYLLKGRGYIIYFYDSCPAQHPTFNRCWIKVRVYMCVCVCVCVRARERWRTKIQNGYSFKSSFLKWIFKNFKSRFHFSTVCLHYHSLVCAVVTMSTMKYCKLIQVIF
jgi:hypothetical protein